MQIPAMITALAAIGALVLTQDSLSATREQLTLTRQGQVSDRFARAVEQLGNTNSVDVRVGAVYSLEKVAKDSTSDRLVVMEVLSNYVRTRSPSIKRDDGSYRCPTESYVPADIEAAVVVIGRRDRSRDETWVDLEGSCLRIRGANQADFRQTILYYCDFSGASLKQAIFNGTTLHQSSFDGAVLYGTSFRAVTGDHASFVGADMVDTVFDGGNFSFANFASAVMHGVTFRGADIRGANLEGTTQENVDLSSAVR